eukprot:TRINITY_DN15990_c0_g1_i1.p1 TRINITY_DN15990_c0_g1~~TRINITY_DN15990_c0_g1_i1.p1  ORF type:complete len:651 (+),score=9.85 TRINITY_DN15990_c0_g1_i1:31-1983(+)
MVWYVHLFLSLFLLGLVSSHNINTYSFNLTEPIARQRSWSVVLSGTTGSRSAVPRRMHTRGCQDRIFVSYTTHTGQYPDPQYPSFIDESTAGHVAEYQISSTGAVTLLKDIKFDMCSEMGNLFATTDCQLLAVLCRSSLTAKDVPGAVDLLQVALNQTGSVPFGWSATSITNASDPNYRIVDQMFLLEFSGGLSASPSSTVMVNHAIGGWNYGHWEVALNAARTLYFVSLKTTIGTWHEGAVTFRFLRGTWAVQKPEWACGTGHILGNRVTYSSSLDKFARYCWTDWNYEENAPNAIFFSTSDASKRPAELRSILAREGAYWNGNGGPMNLVATPTGFLGSAIGPGGDGNPGTIGIIQLPGNSDQFNGNTHYYKWLDIPGNADNLPINNSGQIGFPNLQLFGTGGENSGKYLLGWATGVKFQGVPTTFNVAEIDSDGCVYGEYTRLASGGWGQDDVWGYSPSSGCVVMPYTWTSSPYVNYANCNNCTVDKFSSVMYVTTVCPSGARSATKVCSFLPDRDPLPTCKDGILNQDETGVDCGGTCAACALKNGGRECWNAGHCTGGGPCSYCGGGQCCRQGYGPASCQGLGCTSTHCCTAIPPSSIGGNCSVNADCSSVKCAGGICTENNQSSCQSLVFNLGLFLVILLGIHL